MNVVIFFFRKRRSFGTLFRYSCWSHDDVLCEKDCRKYGDVWQQERRSRHRQIRDQLAAYNPDVSTRSAVRSSLSVAVASRLCVLAHVEALSGKADGTNMNSILPPIYELILSKVSELLIDTETNEIYRSVRIVFVEYPLAAKNGSLSVSFSFTLFIPFFLSHFLFLSHTLSPLKVNFYLACSHGDVKAQKTRKRNKESDASVYAVGVLFLPVSTTTPDPSNWNTTRHDVSAVSRLT